ncbi:hypothetical protein D3P08_00685 [Paenibacillus nanensis]|uniref:Uncharacterized protein n=1 Tax=Paenibacillus nanensis TaxID=393251 RepID=A0A3A1VI14_9BACL|nr:hypothetical protein [Paenibacillus nanensis]RIX60137.1 hypothetical protein D3P08_00685 [Paenibacillus nanensis]
MACEYNIDICFARPGLDLGEPALLGREAGELLKSLLPGAILYMEEVEEEGHEVVIARLNGLAAWASEEQFLDWLDRRLPESWWMWIAGIKAEVILKEDAGPCRLRKRGIQRERA